MSRDQRAGTGTVTVVLRVKIAAFAMLILFVAGVGAYPFVLAYPEWFGDRVVATITSCHPQGKRANCRGTWTGTDGRRHSATVADVSTTDVGHRVAIRVSPLGTREDSAVNRIVFTTLLVVLGVGAPVAGLLMAALRRRRMGADPATPPPDGWSSLLVTPQKVRRPGGEQVATFRQAAEPPGYQPHLPPGRTPRPRTGSALEGIGYLSRNPTRRGRFVMAYGPDGTPLFMFDRVPTGGDEPDTALLDTGGTIRAIIRRTVRHPARFVHLATDGTETGTIEQRARPDAAPRSVLRPNPVELVLSDHQGHQVGTARTLRHGWLVQVADDTRLKDLLLVFAADSGHLLT